MPTIIRFAGYVVIGALGLLVVVIAIARCMADPGYVPRGYIDVEGVWHHDHVYQAEPDPLWRQNHELFVFFRVDRIYEIEEGNKIIVNVGSPPVGRVQLDFKNDDSPLNLQPVRGLVRAECLMDGMSRDSILLLKDCELASFSR